MTEASSGEHTYSGIKYDVAGIRIGSTSIATAA